ncbi:thioredoxin domain-containing protein [Gramella sp. GC03-9]|uniref:Thioredoxin domain-containing protein n=1 Tax=Christiangramia oceanisediminis TaxID=2920386 RepID=A0A9X2KVW6_9FLAO|nr:thioredoxin domain-containing protein [Gramella oceanisediminis]MCP9198644.1 thioredoxin domain-containing protein [Gramella oceanisediminis]
MENPSPEHTNELIKENSPYLLQHAHNPVNWKAWNDESLDLAQNQKKLIIISVGYSACHWCHVMEHESFEDPEVAEIMNKNYISIKVDREERPDVDQVYMNAVQIMTGAGGWPMNVVCLPDGRPVWGGTYFRKEQWKDALKQIAHLYETQPKKLEEYASRLEEGLKQVQLVDTPTEKSNLEKDYFSPIIEKWKRSLDQEYGGPKGAPKFMMPNNYEFLLRYAFQNSDEELMKHCLLTLNRISWGGTYDPVDGGFSRYSVDEKWHVPHFEKMLYDNAQLVQLYSKAYKLTENEWYREVVEQSLEFVENEFSHESGAFYSALDADSEDESGKNEEGAYYTWRKEDLKDLLGAEFELFAEVYNINKFGRWEDDKYVLIRTSEFEEIARRHDLSLEQFNLKREQWKQLLKKERKEREKPGLDDKSLTSWNAMMLTGYLEAYQALGRNEYLERALKNANFLIENQLKPDGRLYRTFKNGESKINAYLEDYAFCIEAFTRLYESCFEEKYLQLAEKLLGVVESDFADESSGLYFFNSRKDRKLITESLEISDNVIPASNSVMAKNLFRLGKITGNLVYIDKAENMLQKILPKIEEFPRYHSNWLDLLLNFTNPFYEVAITGPDHRDFSQYFQEKYIPNIVLAAGDSENIALLRNRTKKDETLIYVCEKGSCKLPNSSKSQSFQQIRQV